jgi:hypothetical protein
MRARRPRRHGTLGLAVLALLSAAVFAAAAGADHVELPPELQQALPTLPDGTAPSSVGSPADVHSENMILVGRFDAGGTYRQGTDLAFWGTLAVAGNYGFPGGFRLLDVSDPRAPRQLGQLVCHGPQNDVSIWQDLVFVSVDSPLAGPDCSPTPNGASTAQTTSGQAFEGIRVVSIADRANPRQVALVDTPCGSHTHTLVPDPKRKRVLVYVLSYPLGGLGTDCNTASHRKISVVEVPLAAPGQARIVSTPDVSPAIGCHDVTVLLSRKLAGAACITESQLWDISDPVRPRVLSHIVNPGVNIHHSTTFSFDGRTLAIGDELGGAAASPGCPDDGDLHLPLGAIWFYDVTNPALPVPRGTFRIPQAEPSVCTAHNFNTVPMKTERDVLVSAWYHGGTTVVDFTDPSAPRQLGYYVAKEPLVSDSWSSYWYRGFIYANNFDEQVDPSNPNGRSRGLDVLAIADRDLKENSIRLKRLNPQTMEPPG